MDDKKAFDEILPEGSIFYMGVDDYALFLKNAESMPMAKILNEEEMVEFLKKPKAYMEESLGQMKKMLAAESEALAAEVDRILGLEMTRFFGALTHATLPDMNDPSKMIPDFGVTFGFTLKGGENPAEIIKNLLKIVGAKSGVECDLVEAEYNRVKYVKVMIPDAPIFPVYFNLDDLFVISLSETSMKGMVDCFKGTSDKNLKNSAKYMDVTKGVSVPEAGAVNFYADMESLMNLAKDGAKMALMFEGEMDMVEKVDLIAEKLGLNSLKASFSRSASVNGMSYGEGFVSLYNSDCSLAKLSPPTPITKEELAIIPKDAVSFSIMRFDFAMLYDMIMDTIKTFDEEAYNEVQGGIQGLCQMISQGGDPIDLRQDLIGQFGAGFINYSTAGGGMAMGAPSMNLLVEVKDYDRFVSALKRIIEGLKQMIPEVNEAVSLSTTTFSETEICYFQISGPMPIPITPAFAKVGNYLAFSLNIDDVKKMIRRHGGEGECITSNEDFASFYSKYPKDAQLVSLGYTRLKQTLGEAYNQVAMLAPMTTMALPPEIELPVDLQLLPTGECITDHLYSSITAGIKLDDTNMKMMSYGPIGAEMIQYIGPITGLAMCAINDYYLRAKPKVTPFEMTEISPEEEVSVEEVIDEGAMKAAKVRTVLAKLSSACFLYKIEYVKFPSSLEHLLKSNDNWPNGFYESETLPMDEWGNKYLYKLLTGDKCYMIWSCGPNGTDDSGEGDDIAKSK